MAVPLPRRAGVPKGTMLVLLQLFAALTELILHRFPLRFYFLFVRTRILAFGGM